MTLRENADGLPCLVFDSAEELQAFGERLLSMASQTLDAERNDPDGWEQAGTMWAPANWPFSININC